MPPLYLPKLDLREALFDTSILIAFQNHDQRIRQQNLLT